MVDMMYNRQEKLQLDIPAEVSVVGVGGVGSWVAIDLAMTGVEKLNLFDEDNLEIHNLNRLPFSADDIGKPKTQILSEFIGKIRPHAIVMPFGYVTPMTASLLSGVVVDCTDKIGAQKLIYATCVKRSMHYFRVGYDGMHFTVVDGQHPEAITPKAIWGDDTDEGYTITPSWVVPPQIDAALITHIICSGKRYPTLSMNIDDIWKGVK